MAATCTSGQQSLSNICNAHQFHLLQLDKLLVSFAISRKLMYQEPPKNEWVSCKINTVNCMG